MSLSAIPTDAVFRDRLSHVDHCILDPCRSSNTGSLDIAPTVAPNAGSASVTLTITVEVMDRVGARASKTFSLTINAKPQIRALQQAHALTVGRFKLVQLELLFGTAPLTLSAASSNTSLIPHANLVAQGSAVLVTAWTREGSCLILVTVRDSKGQQATTNFSVTVNRNYSQTSQPDYNVSLRSCCSACGADPSTDGFT